MPDITLNSLQVLEDVGQRRGRIILRVSPENALFPRNTRCKISHCQNFDLKTSFMNVISYLWCNEGEFAPTRETRLALSFDSNLFGFVT